MIVLEWGMPYDDFIAEAWPLIRAHWHQVGSNRDILRLDPDHDVYRALESKKRLHILTARDGAAMAGYMFVLTIPHARDKSAMVGRNDIIYVDPKYRRHMVGPRMIEEALRHLESLGVDIVLYGEKVARHAGGAFLKRFGFEPFEIVHAKVIRKVAEQAA